MGDVFDKIRGQIEDFEIAATGHLKWNPYLGETKEALPRGNPSTCISIMVRGRMEDGSRSVLLIDPTLRVIPEDYYFDTNQWTGLHREDITHCLVIYSHYDHQAGLNYFPKAAWYVAEPVTRGLRSSEHIDGGRVVGVRGELLPGVYALPLPDYMGHLHGAAFWAGDRRVVMAGDGVMTRDHFRYQASVFEQDSEEAAKTIRMLSDTADVIVPGYGNLIMNDRGGSRRHG